MLRDQENECVGIYNENTANRAQKDVSIREQIGIAHEWIQKALLEKEISPEDVEKLGVKALAKKLDMFSLFHLQDFITKNLNDAEELQQGVINDIDKLGIDPTKINLEHLKTAVPEKIGENTQVAVKAMQDKIMSIWKAEMSHETAISDGKDPSQQRCLEIIQDKFLGGNFRDETEFIMKAKVREPFGKDTEGGLQISRFERLLESSK